MRKILVVDDDAEIRAHLVDVLAGAGYQSDAATSGDEALKKAAAEAYDVILLDMVMPGGSGGEVLPDLKRMNPRSKIIVITAFATIKNAVDVMQKGASDYLVKPFKIDGLLAKVRHVAETAHDERRGQCKDIEGVLGILSNPIRTQILRLIHSRKSIRIMEISRELSINDTMKVIVHLKILKEAGIIAQDGKKSYVLTGEGEKTMYCLDLLEKRLAVH